jgi:hypothetical protein
MRPMTRKKRTLPKTFTGTAQMPDAPVLPAARRKHSVPPAKGAPVPPPPMWNYEGKEGPAPKQAKAPPGGPAPAGPDAAVADDPAKAAGVDARKAAEQAEDRAALVETADAIDELREQVALLAALVAHLPE